MEHWQDSHMRAQMNRDNTFDVIVIGAGSIGTPTAYFLSSKGLSVLVLEKAASVGQGSNKSAIGGIRATHSHPAKFHLCQDSIRVFSNWEDQSGDDIEWVQGGYSFVAYTPEIEKELKSIVEEQHQLNANINWLTPSELKVIIPSINTENLLGGTFSPEDGSASPLKTMASFYNQAILNGADFHFNEPATSINSTNDNRIQVNTENSIYHANYIVNCAGAWINDLYSEDEKLPVNPNSHEAGVTEPLEHFLDPMIVDMRLSPGLSNIYYYQHKTGQIIFCSTPSPPIWGFNTKETSGFLPKASQRILALMPTLSNCKVRRTWRGLYPMTPDGSPLIGWDKQLPNAIIAGGMCGQGFMLGPGVAKLITRMILKELNPLDTEILRLLSPYRDFNNRESLE